VVLPARFSAIRFWADVVRFDCTLFRYIGEHCRYLLNAPKFEKEHHLRLACGNGLRGDIWKAVQERFAIPRILEFYAATEGNNFSLYNLEGEVGAIGKIPPLLAHGFPAALVKIDAELDGPLRDQSGLCTVCARNEVGEAIGRIGTADEGGGRFEGYTDKRETEKKVLRDVLAKGDTWFRTGDLMRQDEQGYFYFVDRVSDTFRWKGENVATSEVNDAIRDCPGVLDAASCGVTVPDADGRAGMAAILVDRRFDLKTLLEHLTQRLPPFAHPVFVRISDMLEATETFKQKKPRLIREGFDPTRNSDVLYFRDTASTTYRSLEAEDFSNIARGIIRL
jgi:fatty-acyl-CoA synthase